MLRDILLQTGTYPEPTPEWAFTVASQIADQCGADLSLCVSNVIIPSIADPWANSLLGVDAMIAHENRKSADNVDVLRSLFDAAVPKTRRGNTVVLHSPGAVTPWGIAGEARTHDLVIAPAYGQDGAASTIEGLIFESGKPVLILPFTDQRMAQFQHVTVAWDGSRVAARTLADALPFCKQAATVSVVQVVGDKELPKSASLENVLGHLARHGVTAQSIEIARDGSAAQTIFSHCEGTGSDLLVMGAFGHSRARQFILGGVTKSALDTPKLPILMSH